MKVLLMIPLMLYALVLGATWFALRKSYGNYPASLKFGITGNLVVFGLPLFGGNLGVFEILIIVSIIHFIFCAHLLADDWQKLRQTQRAITLLLCLSPIPLLYLFWFMLLPRLYAFYQ